MKSAFVAFLLAYVVPAAISTTHSTCYNYFLQKDGCVFSSASDKTRCSASPKKHPSAVSAFELRPKRLQRRYDNTKPSFPVAGGDGICGSYDSKTQLGVCLWSGAEQNNPTVDTAGWLNGPKRSNCGKRVYIQRTGHPETVQYAKVLDGCSFNAKTTDDGCFQIGMTLKLFDLFKPSEQERSALKLFGGMTWDFDNLTGNSTQQGPV